MKSYKLNPEKYYGIRVRYESMKHFIINSSKMTKYKDTRDKNEYLIRLDVDTIQSKLLRTMYEA